jgi:hypothetical protein
VAAAHARTPTLSPCSAIVPGAHVIVTKLIAFSNVSAIRRASGEVFKYAFSMHSICELAMPSYSKNTV